MLLLLRTTKSVFCVIERWIRMCLWVEVLLETRLRVHVVMEIDRMRLVEVFFEGRSLVRGVWVTRVVVLFLEL